MKTLIFDLDETLIHCLDDHDMKTDDKPAGDKEKKQRPKFDAVVPIKYSKEEVINANLYFRPGAIECLTKLKKHFEIVIFTASHPCYANRIIDMLDPQHSIISYRLFRDNCHKTADGVHIKDLRIIANRNPQDLILVDNAAHSYGFQLANGVPIVPFYCDKQDRQLFELVDFLLPLHDAADVRPLIQKTFKSQAVWRFSQDFKQAKDSLLQPV